MNIGYHLRALLSFISGRTLQISRLGIVMLIASAGLLFAVTGNIHGFEHSSVYLAIATGLLCFGLYMAGYGIDLSEARKHWRIVIIAITVGVLAKYAIIAGFSYLITGDWRYAAIGMAVAQIDPLSVAALSNDRRMSARTKTVLTMWASFDDPMTALATPILLGLIAQSGGRMLMSGQSMGAMLADIGPFAAALIGMAIMVLWRRKQRSARFISKQIRDEIAQFEGEGPKTAIVQATLITATWLKNPPTAALVSVVFRPAWLGGKFGELLTSTALYGATFLLGVLLAEGVEWRGGLVLGVTTYASQMIVAWLVVWLSALITPTSKKQNTFSVREVWHLALAQQNGITAIVLALVLQPIVPIAVATISLAIVVVNLTKFCANWLFDTVVEPRFWPVYKNDFQGSEMIEETD